MASNRVIRNFYVLPCCVLLLNLCVGVVSYKTQRIESHFLRTLAIIAVVLFGGSAIGFLLEPILNGTVGALHRRSRRHGRLGEIVFLGFLGAVVFVLYYRMYILGPPSILPRAWWNAP